MKRGFHYRTTEKAVTAAELSEAMRELEAKGYVWQEVDILQDGTGKATQTRVLVEAAT